MNNLFHLLAEADRIKQEIRYEHICEAYNAADLKKDDLNGYNANTQSFRQYIIEIKNLLDGLNQEMQKIYNLDTKMFSRNANLDNINALEQTLNKKLENDLSSKYLIIEYKLFLCIKVFYRIFEVFKSLNLEVQSELADGFKTTKNHLIKIITAVRDAFKTQQGKYGCIHNYAENIISVENADKYFTLDNLKSHYLKGIDVLGGSSSSFIRK